MTSPTPTRKFQNVVRGFVANFRYSHRSKLKNVSCATSIKQSQGLHDGGAEDTPATLVARLGRPGRNEQRDTGYGLFEKNFGAECTAECEATLLLCR